MYGEHWISNFDIVPMWSYFYQKIRKIMFIANDNVDFDTLKEFLINIICHQR